MVYLLTGDIAEAVHCAKLFDLKEWKFASEITEKSTGEMWLYGNYIANPYYYEIRNRSRIIDLKEINKNQ